MPTQRATRIAIAFIAFFVLQGMAPPGCTGSQVPLGDPQAESSALYLVGDWHVLEFGYDGEFEVGQIHLEVSRSESGELTFHLFDDEEDPDSLLDGFFGYPVRIGAKQYLNLRLDMSEWEEEDRNTFEEMPCPYFIVQYSTFPPRRVATEAAKQALYSKMVWLDSRESESEVIPMSTLSEDDENRLTDKILLEASEYSGRLLLYSKMDDDFVADAITDGRIKGFTDCETCLGACIQVDVEDLRGFITGEDEQLFHDWNWLIRPDM